MRIFESKALCGGSLKVPSISAAQTNVQRQIRGVYGCPQPIQSLNRLVGHAFHEQESRYYYSLSDYQ